MNEVDNWITAMKMDETLTPALIAIRMGIVEKSDGDKYANFYVARLNLNFGDGRISGEWIKFATSDRDIFNVKTFICAGKFESSLAIFLINHNHSACYVCDAVAGNIRLFLSGEIEGIIIAAHYWRGEIFILVDAKDHEGQTRHYIYKYNINTQAKFIITYLHDFVGLKMQTRFAIDVNKFIF